MDASPTNPESEQVLSQAEVERLVARATEKEAGAQAAAGNLDSKNPVRHDFRSPSYLAAMEMRKLRLRHEEFLRGLAARLSIHLRMEFNLKLLKLHTQTHEAFAETLGNATHLTIFKAEPLRGLGVIEISTRLGLSMVDRLMGGSGQPANPEHDLSEIELALVEQTVQVILEEWCRLWPSEEKLQPVILGTETSGRYLQTSPPTAVLLVLSLEARLGDSVESMQLALPCATLEPLIRRMDPPVELPVAPAVPPSGPSATQAWNRRFDDVPVAVTAEWVGVEISARDISQLKVGDVLALDPACAGRVAIRLADHQKFFGRLGTQGDRRAIEIAGPFQDLNLP